MVLNLEMVALREGVALKTNLFHNVILNNCKINLGVNFVSSWQ
jgi:hypothetical protein